MKTLVSILFVIAIPRFVCAQIVMNSGAKINIEGGTATSPTCMVLVPTTLSPILFGTGDGIIMRNEFDCIQYELGTNLTAITVPYMSVDLEQIPLDLTPTTVGVGNGNIRFSTKVAADRSTGFDNFLYLPYDVTNMASIISANNSNWAIDRFWIIDAIAYTTKPSVNISFTYSDLEWQANGGNTINEADMRAQRFNNLVNDWEGYSNFTPAGTINTALNKVTGVAVSAQNFYRSWTLNVLNTPLPIQLISFDAKCEGNQFHFNWKVASESDMDSYRIEGSQDGLIFEVLGVEKAKAKANFNEMTNYDLLKSVPEKINYFRLTQVDINGVCISSAPIYRTSCTNKIDFKFTNTGANFTELFIKSDDTNDYEILFHDELGRLVKRENIHVQSGVNSFYFDSNNFSNGIYNACVLKTNGDFKYRQALVFINNN